MKNTEVSNQGDEIKADICSRPNYDKYRVGQISGLDDLWDVKSTDIYFLESLKVRADSADKVIAKAESRGEDTSDPNVMKSLGREINDLGTLIHRSESVMTAVIVSLKLTAFFGMAAGIWGVVFNQSFLWFGLYGLIAGLLIFSLFVAPVIAGQRTREQVKDIVAGVSMLLVPIGTVIAVLGIIAWVIKLIFL